MGQHPTDDLEAAYALVPALRGIVAEALTPRLLGIMGIIANAERIAREHLAALPSEDVQAVYMLPRWTLPEEGLAGPAYRSARWAVATMHGEHRGKAPPPVARLDELTDAERAYLHGLVVARAHVAHVALDLDLPIHGEGWPTVPTLPEEGGMLAWTFRLLGHLEAYLDKCTDALEADRTWMREWLDTAREEEEAAWGDGTALACWHLRVAEFDKGPRWLNMVALAVWVLEVAPRVAHARRPVAVKQGTLQGLTSILTRGGVVEVLAPSAAPQVARAWVHTATLDGEALERIRRGTGLLASPIAPRMVAMVAHRIQRRIDPREPLEWRGGDGRNAWAAMAAELGVEDPKEVREVRVVFETLGHLHYRSPTGREVGGLWTTDYRPGGGRGKVGRLIVTPNAGICSGVDDTDEAADRFLVPLPELPGWCAPMVGRPNERGAYARLWLWTLTRLRTHAEDLTRGTGVLIDGATWAAAGVEVGLSIPEPLLVVSRLVDRWTRDGDDGPAVLEERAPNRYHLAEHLAADRAFLEEAGRLTIQGRKGGKAAAARRAHPTMRRGKPHPDQ
jgi:hypothetical protein